MPDKGTAPRRRVLGLRRGTPTTESHQRGLTNLANLFTAALSRKQREYQPKVCGYRYGGRRCTLPRHSIDQRHNIPVPSRIQIPAAPRRVTMHPSPYRAKRSPRAAQVPGVREHMAEIRRRNTPQREQNRILVQQQKIAHYKRQLAALRHG